MISKLFLMAFPSAASLAYADTPSGVKLAGNCTASPDDSNCGWFECYAFVNAVVELTSVDAFYCIPKNDQGDPKVSTGRLTYQVGEYVRKNPDAVTVPGNELVQNALAAAFPCSGNGDSSSGNSADPGSR
jgi:hypothetical protein